MSTVPLLTINTYNFDTQHPIGTITKSGVSIKLYIDKKDRKPGQWIVSNVSGIFGGKSIVVTRSISDAVESAKEKFMLELRQKYPNAICVIGLKIDLSATLIDNALMKDENVPAIIATMTGTVIGPK